MEGWRGKGGSEGWRGRGGSEGGGGRGEKVVRGGAGGEGEKEKRRGSELIRCESGEYEMIVTLYVKLNRGQL